VQSFNDIFVWDFVSDELECADGLVLLRSWVDGVALDGGDCGSGAVVCAATTLAASRASKANPPAARFMAVLHGLSRELIDPEDRAGVPPHGSAIPAIAGRTGPTAARLI
jgi:hypothetical protein